MVDDANDSGAQNGSIDGRHLLLVGAGGALGEAVARRFAEGRYRVTLLARSPGGLGELADGLADTGADIDTVAADAGDPEGLGARVGEIYSGQGAPGVILYNAVMGAPDRLLTSTVAHLQTAYAVDVIGAIVVAQGAVPSMRAARSGTILFTAAGSPIIRFRRSPPSHSARRRCVLPRRSFRPTWNRTASAWPA